MIEDEGAQQVVAFYDAILESRGIRLAPDSMILDYGCGSGRHTYEYLDAGYCNAFGYDLQNYVALRAPKDRERFRFDPIPGNAGGYPRMSEVPWPADTFHFIFATSVFEHVADQELAYAEIHRVLKPGGAFLNIFPSKWRPIEAHINIPFGGVFTWRPYLQLCAVLGIRGLNQETCTAAEVVELNRLFTTYGVNYLSGRQIAVLLRRIFGEFEYVEDAYIRHSPGRSRHLAVPLTFVPMLREAFRFAHTRAFLARKRK
ncbi:MAG TPA: class I SAM-dependent methyltransferase [Xanthobacteraceae bacterium]|jgi:SAM-dependent methyltransferase|nr:class I SAM-dependent methyltransferase [Xanthobacteraceae bacterium]